MPIVSLHGLILDIDIHYAHSEPSTQHANGYSELEWTCASGQDEIGENISTNALDLICDKYINDIERAIWAQIEG
ncbi:hypothetical protein D3C71_277030 [compost metagenome]